MGRQWSSQVKDEPKQKDLDPIWRGVGFLVLVGLTLGGWFGAGFILDLNRQYGFLPFPVPEGYTTHIFGPVYLSARIVVQFLMMVVVDLVGYAVMTIVYGVARPPKRSEFDAAPSGRRPNRPSR